MEQLKIKNVHALIHPDFHLWPEGRTMFDPDENQLRLRKGGIETIFMQELLL